MAESLTLDRDYIRRGMRELSQELIERELGPRLEHEILLARGRTIEREQWTEIDRALERRAGADRVVSYENFEASQRGRESQGGAGDGAAANSSKSWDWRGASSERSWELSAEHEAGAAPAPARARHPQNQGARAAAGTGEGTRSRDGDGEVEGDGGVSSLSGY